MLVLKGVLPDQIYLGAKCTMGRSTTSDKCHSHDSNIYSNKPRCEKTVLNSSKTAHVLQ